MSAWFLLRRLSPTLLQRFFLICFLAQFIAFLAVQAVPGDCDRLGRVRGRDFLQFYVAGRIVNAGQAERLYDQDYFGTVQESVVEIGPEKARYFALYPPAMALLATPFALLPYTASVLLWWVCTAGLFAVAAWLLTLGWPAAERPIVWLGLASFQPVVITFWDGQLSAVWLLAVLSGLRYHQRDRRFLAGLVFSVLALKPQLAVGLGLWLLLRGEVRALLGMATGTAAQQGLVAMLLGPNLLLRYVENARIYADLQQLYQFDPSYQHSLSGILIDLFGTEYATVWRGVHALVVLLAAGLVFRFPRGAGSPGSEPLLAVLLTLLAAPHLLLYDLSLLAIPIVLLSKAGSSSAGWAVLLYLAAMGSPFYQLSRFSVVPVVILLTVYSITRCRSASSPCAGARFTAA